ncbi:UNVERIFIED_CONTAM: hypothetical protein FKN15_047962 [Acipenser sinensis]
MNDQNNTEEMQRIFQEAPAARQCLLDNYSNLHKVAEYCESNYLQSTGQDNMNDQNNTEEMQRIFQEAPAARQCLLDNYSNLHKVAEYCESNYLQGEDQAKALEETKAFTAQSLASVAYQISTLATSVLKLLDVQTDELSRMESSVNLVTQVSEILCVPPMYTNTGKVQPDMKPE